MAENATLDQAVKDAVDKENTTETQQTDKTADTTTSKETKSEVKTEIKDQPTESETLQNERMVKAMRLYESLEDPNVGPAVVRSLAEKAGILGLQQGKTEKQITKSVVDVLKESLGAEYEFLADKLAVGIDTIVKQSIKEQIQPLELKTKEAMDRAVKADVDAAYAQMESVHKDFKEYDKEMTELSKELPYTGDYPMERYLERLYKLVTSDKKETKIVKQTVDKINKNAKELRDSSTEVQETRITKGSKLPSLNEAVSAAMRGEKFTA